MGTLKRQLRHAFAIDDEQSCHPTPEQQPAVDWVCRHVAKRGMTLPGLVVLEMTRPLNFIASQAMHFSSPLIWAIARQQTHENYDHFARFLEHRGSSQYLARRIEHFEDELRQKRAARRRGQDSSAQPQPHPGSEHSSDENRS